MKALLEPAFQPIYDLDSGVVSHYEALARIRDDPTDAGHWKLIQLAERHHFIHRIDIAILEMAAEAGRLAKQRIGANLSPLTIESHLQDVITRIRDLKTTEEGGLVVEITESMPIRDRHKVAYFIDAVREAGCRVALDDFGNGQGLFTEELVCFLRPDLLKLDGTIIGHASGSGDRRGVQHAAALARYVEAEVIAEFVDSEEKIDMLESCGVRYAQGWAIGKATRNAFILGNANGKPKRPPTLRERCEAARRGLACLPDKLCRKCQSSRNANDFSRRRAVPGLN